MWGYIIAALLGVVATVKFVDKKTDVTGNTPLPSGGGILADTSIVLKDFQTVLILTGILFTMWFLIPKLARK